MGEQVLDKAFQLDPTTVYAFLVALLVVGMIVLSLVIARVWKDLKEERERRDQLLTNAITVISNVTNVLASVQDVVAELSDKFPAHLDKCEINIRQEVVRAQASVEKAITALK